MVFLKKFAIFVVCVVGLAYGVSFALPSGWEVSRKMQIGVDSHLIHQTAGDFDHWKRWSPWCPLEDGTLKLTPSKRSTGVDATLEFEGRDLGKGTIKLTSSDPERGLWFDVESLTDHERLQGSVEYEHLPNGTTMVKLTLSGDVSESPIGRYVALMRNYTTGPVIVDSLSRLKKISESMM